MDEAALAGWATFSTYYPNLVDFYSTSEEHNSYLGAVSYESVLKTPPVNRQFDANLLAYAPILGGLSPIGNAPVLYTSQPPSIWDQFYNIVNTRSEWGW